MARVQENAKQRSQRIGVLHTIYRTYAVDVVISKYDLAAQGS